MATKKCPYCAEEIQEEAIKCKHCGEWLDQHTTTSPSPSPEPSSVEAPAAQPEAYREVQKPPHVLPSTRESGTGWGTARTVFTILAGFLFIGFCSSLVTREPTSDRSTTPSESEPSDRSTTPSESTVSVKIMPDPDETQTLMVNVQVGNIRQNPTTEAAVVKQAKYGDFLTQKGEEGDWFRVSWVGGEGWVHNSIVVGEDGILEAGEKLLKEKATELDTERKENFSKLLSKYQELGMKKLEDQGVTVFVQWEENNWDQLPYDLKKQILDSFELMKNNRAIIHIYGYRSGKVLAKTGVFSDTIN